MAKLAGAKAQTKDTNNEKLAARMAKK